MFPVQLLIKPASSLCNMRCKYCFYADVASNREVASYGIMSDETLEVLVKKALATAKGYCNFAFQGGEPTLAGIGFYRRLIELQKKYNINNVTVNNSIQTNGYIIDDEWADFFAKNHFLVGISVDGPAEIHDNFRIDAAGKGTHNRVMKAAALFEKYDVEYNVLCVVNNLVARHGQKVYRFFTGKGMKYIQFIPCLDEFDAGETQDYSLSSKRYGDFLKATFDLYYADFLNNDYTGVRQFDNYVSMIMGNAPESCGMSGCCTAYFVVESNGDVYPCDFYVLDRYRMGNIAENSFEEMRHSAAATDFVEQSKYVDENCKGCRWYAICRGGCRRNREPFTDGKPGLNQFCSAYKAFFEYSADRLRKMAAVASRR